MAPDPLQRLRRIDEMLAARPSDPFLRYARALELLGLGRDAEAMAAWTALADSDPAYPATYQAAGQHLADRGRPAEAADWYRRGIPAARAAGEARMAAEMAEALALLEDDDA